MLTLSRTDLVRALGATLPLAKPTRKATLRPVRIWHQPGGITMEACRGEARLRQSLAGTGNGTDITLDPRLLRDAVRDARTGEVTLEAQDEMVHVQTGSLQATVPATSVEWPDETDEPWRTAAVCSMEALQAALARCLPFACKGTSRFALEGVSLRAKRGEALRMAASDTHRLSVCILPGTARKNLDLILPAETARLIRKLPAGGNVHLQMQPKNTEQVCLRAPRHWQLVTPLTDGTFPRYEAVIPTKTLHGLQVRRTAFLAELVQAGRLADATSHRVMLLTDENGQVTLSAERGALTSSAVVDGTCIPWAGDWRYLRDALKACKKETVTLRFCDRQSPLRIDEDDWTHVIMPVRMQ